MKKITIVTMCVMCSTFCRAQTFQEWFNQKRTQIKYLIEQVAAFQVYTGYIEKGYDIANKGLGTIRNLKKGDFNLHSDYFNSLKQVSPSVKQYGKVADIIAMQQSIVKISKLALTAARKSPGFTKDEIAYLNKVNAYLLSETVTDIDQLLQLVTDGSFEMKDDERMQRIDKIYRDMKDKYAFVQSFSDESSVLVQQHKKEQQEVSDARKIHGIQ